MISPSGTAGKNPMYGTANKYAQEYKNTRALPAININLAQ
jgi:hypothetical protein